MGKYRLPKVLFSKPNPIKLKVQPRFKYKDLLLPTTRSSVSFIVLSSYFIWQISAKRSLVVLTYAAKFWRKSSAYR